MKKLLASMLAVLMLLVAVPQMCFADDVDVSETTDGVDTYEYRGTGWGYFLKQNFPPCIHRILFYNVTA